MVGRARARTRRKILISTGPALPVIYALALQLAFNALLQVAFGLEDPYARAGGRGLHDSVSVRRWSGCAERKEKFTSTRLSLFDARRMGDQSRAEMERTAREASLPWDADLGIVGEGMRDRVS